MMQVPEDLKYTDEHEWIKQIDGRLRVGITDYAQDQLGDIVYVEIPEVGKSVAKEDILVEVESTKSVGEVYSPVAGTIAAVNEAVADNPELVNSSPYEEGWLVEIDPEGELDDSALLDATAYRELTE
ncbi:MAG: glycine cleavage system protein GcvH [Actinobacteria bacterium]|nr:MAG: glycine cleavage system protein GcvH [Actinomycetota bacterium]REK34870.1 MAG: glycine cleavage system protein GcvH [Actinomycetota bacterium]